MQHLHKRLTILNGVYKRWTAGIVDQEMDQQLWGEVDNKRKRILKNKRIRMFLYNRNDPIELDIEYYPNNVLTAGMYIKQE